MRKGFAHEAFSRLEDGRLKAATELDNGGLEVRVRSRVVWSWQAHTVPCGRTPTGVG